MGDFNRYIINKNNLENNIKKIRKYVGYSTKICAVVKANAYGVGVENVCPIISDYVDYYAVVTTKEAVRLRSIDSIMPILVLGASDFDYLDWCAENNVMISISSLDDVRYINKHASAMVKVHIKINSGMNRYGVKTLTMLREILKEIRKSNKICIVGAYTHFATKSENLGFIDEQYEFFMKMVKEIKIKDLIVHCANSFVSTTDKLKLCNMVRVGFSLYSNHYHRLGIRNVISIKSRIVFMSQLNKGESVGYDRTHIAPKKEIIGVVPMGYADGFARNLSNNFKVLVNGQFVKVVGRVCMDCFMVDLTNVKNVYVGSEVVVLGESGDNLLTLEDYSKALDFSPYEVLTNFRTSRMSIEIK